MAMAIAFTFIPRTHAEPAGTGVGVRFSVLRLTKVGAPGFEPGTSCSQSRKEVGAIASTSTDSPTKSLERESVCFVGRVGIRLAGSNPHAST